MEHASQEDAEVKNFLVVPNPVGEEADQRGGQEHTEWQNTVDKGNVQVTGNICVKPSQSIRMSLPHSDVLHVDGEVRQDGEGSSSISEECHLERQQLPVQVHHLLLSRSLGSDLPERSELQL